MSVTIEDVAARAGVSSATVSRALRDLPHVSRATRSRVVAAATDLGYHANRTIHRTSGHGGSVVAVVPYLDRWYFASVLRHVGVKLRGLGFDLLVHHLGDNFGRMRFFDHVLVRGQVDAVLVVSLGLTMPESVELRSIGVPVVVLGPPSPIFPSVGIDDVAGAQSAVRHLVELGRREIGIIGGGRADPFRFTTPTMRRKAYAAILRAAGLRADPELAANGYFTVAGGEHAMAQLLAARRPPDSVFVQSDEMAFGALRALRRSGLRVPDDVAMVGFDGHDLAEVADLSTVAQPLAEQCDAVVTTLMEMVSGQSWDRPRVVLPTRLIVRASTSAGLCRWSQDGVSPGLGA